MRSVRGETAELICAAAVLEFGWEWAWVSPGLPFDGLMCLDMALDSTRWWRVQVKRIFKWKKHHPAVNMLRGNGKRYKKGDADYLAAVDVDAKLMYLIPWGDVYKKSRVTINPEKYQSYLVG